MDLRVVVGGVAVVASAFGNVAAASATAVSSGVAGGGVVHLPSK